MIGNSLFVDADLIFQISRVHGRPERKKGLFVNYFHISSLLREKFLSLFSSASGNPTLLDVINYLINLLTCFTFYLTFFLTSHSPFISQTLIFSVWCLCCALLPAQYFILPFLYLLNTVVFQNHNLEFQKPKGPLGLMKV